MKVADELWLVEKETTMDSVDCLVQLVYQMVVHGYEVSARHVQGLPSPREG